MIGIGIDTGGTYTDAIVYDLEKEIVLGSGKSPTTHQNLEIGIEGALNTLPEEMLKKGEFLALSTTLATNACVEGKGAPAKLIFIGVEYKTVEEMYQKYGLPHPSDIIFLERSERSWTEILDVHLGELKNYENVAIVQIFAREDGGKYERDVEAYLKEKIDVACVLGHELFQERNVLKRGASALLNAQLIPVIRNFIQNVQAVLKRKNLQVPIVIVRSDGNLMSMEFALEHPVETLLCGPAASVMAGAKLTKEPHALIVDMGGTTTDAAIVENELPVMEKHGISIGKWSTFVSGLYVDTFGLGGDSAVRFNNVEQLYLDTRRVVPLCVLASEYPAIKDELRKLLEEEYVNAVLPFQEFYVLVRDISGKEGYTEDEQKLCTQLKNGPLSLKQAAAAVDRDMYVLNMKRLEEQGIIIRSGLTPTDIMHIKGDFSVFDKEASELAVKHMARCGYMTEAALADKVYDLVTEKMYCNFVRILWNHENPSFTKYKDTKIWEDAIARSYRSLRDGKDSFCQALFRTKAVLVGIGAPVHVFLNTVAEMLGTRAIIPEEAPAANALGAVLGNVTATYTVEIQPEYTGAGISGFTVMGKELVQYETLEEAREAAIEYAKQKAEELVQKRGASKYVVSAESKQIAPVIGEDAMLLSEKVIGKAIGKIAFLSDK